MPTKLKTASAGKPKPSYVSKATVTEFFRNNATVVSGVRVTMLDVMNYLGCSHRRAAGKVNDDNDILIYVAEDKALA